MRQFILRRTAKIGERYWSEWFVPKEGLLKYGMTKREYEDLALPGAGAPANPTGDEGSVWQRAWAEWEFDTPTGYLEPGDITDAFPGTVNVELPEGVGKLQVPASRVIGSLDNLSFVTFQPQDLPAKVEVIAGVLRIAD